MFSRWCVSPPPNFFYGCDQFGFNAWQSYVCSPYVVMITSWVTLWQAALDHLRKETLEINMNK